MTKRKKDKFTGIEVIDVDFDFVSALINRQERGDDCPEINMEAIANKESQLISDYKLYSNSGLVLKAVRSKDKTQKTFLARTSTDNSTIQILNEDIKFFGDFKPRNKEQKILANILQDKDVKLHIIPGPAGSGKTILTSAYALHSLVTTKEFDKVIFTKSMYQVGAVSLGAMPGDVKDKFSPYLINFRSNLEQLFGLGGMMYHDALEEKGKIQYIPIQLMRGASFQGALVIVDEAQNLNCHETKTIGTRLGDGCKLIYLGDLTQIDRKGLTETKTGLHHLMNSEIIKNSPMASSIELIKNERSPLSNLIESAFGNINE